MNQLSVKLAFSLITFAAIRIAFGQVEQSQPEAQIIVIAEKTQRYAWREDLTLAQALMKAGGTSADSVFLVRRGITEKLKITANLNRKLEAWDIIVLGYRPAPP